MQIFNQCKYDNLRGTKKQVWESPAGVTVNALCPWGTNATYSAPIIARDHELPYSRQVFDLAVFMPDALPHTTPEVILCLHVE